MSDNKTPTQAKTNNMKETAKKSGTQRVEQAKENLRKILDRKKEAREQSQESGSRVGTAHHDTKPSHDEVNHPIHYTVHPSGVECLMDELLKLIAEVERDHFRTDCDSGAADQAMLVWNRVRQFAGLPRITKLDLPSWCVICESYHVTPHKRKAP